MKGMPSSFVISLQLPGDIHLELLALHDTWAGDEEEGFVETDVESAEFHFSLSHRRRPVPDRVSHRQRPVPPKGGPPGHCGDCRARG